jgi:hypothetical protein
VTEATPGWARLADALERIPGPRRHWETDGVAITTVHIDGTLVALAREVGDNGERLRRRDCPNAPAAES